MPRPLIILNVYASVDGRITTGPGRNGLECHKLYDELDAVVGQEA